METIRIPIVTETKCIGNKRYSSFYHLVSYLELLRPHTDGIPADVNDLAAEFIRSLDDFPNGFSKKNIAPLGYIYDSSNTMGKSYISLEENVSNYIIIVKKA